MSFGPVFGSGLLLGLAASHRRPWRTSVHSCQRSIIPRPAHDVEKARRQGQGGILAALVRLHVPHKSCTLATVLAPPRDQGTTWSY